MNYNTEAKKIGVFPLIFKEYWGAHSFGMSMLGRQRTAENYRYGFNFIYRRNIKKLSEILFFQ